MSTSFALPLGAFGKNASVGKMFAALAVLAAIEAEMAGSVR